MNRQVFDKLAHGIEGCEITWAGRDPLTGELCYGTDAGALLFSRKDRAAVGERYVGRKFSSEPINGIAFCREYIAASSRESVTLRRRLDDGNFSPLRVFGDFGSHPIISRANDGFIAPLGIGGLLLINLDAGETNGSVFAPPEGEESNFYRLAPLTTQAREEIFACAARKSGLLAITVRDGLVTPPITGHHFPGIDVVDICSLKSPDFPRAIAALDMDGNIFLMHDVSDRPAPLTLNFPELRGTGYTILSTQGHVIVLTDVALITIPNLAHDFLAGKSLAEDRPTFIMQIEAYEAFLINSETLVALVDGRAISYRIAELTGCGDAHLAERAENRSHTRTSPDTIESALYRPNISAHTDWQTSTIHPAFTPA